MPYYLRLGKEDGTIGSIGPYDDRRSAHAALATHAGHAIVYVDTEDDRAIWTARERSKFSDGTYSEVPWSALDTYSLHFAHRSIKHPGKVAYTADSEAGFQDRQIALKPGKYLEQFYGATDLLVRQDWIRQCATIGDTFAIASSADEIERVYRGSTTITSCMDRSHHFRVHPARVYGDSDLACAYLGPIEDVKARAIVFTRTKKFYRVFPDRDGDDRAQAEILRSLLLQAGYSSGNLNGARIRAIEHGDGWLMPYIDGPSWGEDTGDGWIVLGSGSINVNTTHGSTDMASDEDDQGTCDRCNEYCNRDDMTDDLCASCYDMRHSCEHCDTIYFCEDGENTCYCESCENDRQYCECCESDYWDESHYSVARDEYVCDDCARHNNASQFDCAHCGDTCREWTLDRQVQADRIDDRTALLYCDACGPSFVHCPACDTWYDTDPDDTTLPRPDRCPSCDATPRCTHTLDLLATLTAEPIAV